jgi:D-alanine-D-alanine ligase
LPLAAIDYSLFNDYHERLCSYDAKWDPASAAYLLTSVQCPAHVDRDLTQKLVGVGRRAYRALRLRDYGRVDIRVRDGVPYVLDVNSNPDITMEGGFARSARAAGYDYGRTISHILHLASARDNQPSPVFVPAAVPA